MDQIHVVYITAGTRDEAMRIARHLVEERLVACANIISGVSSLYWWQGEVRADNEMIVIVKTTAARLTAVERRVAELHTYECPCIISWPVERGSPAYLDWVRSEVVAADGAGGTAGASP